MVIVICPKKNGVDPEQVEHRKRPATREQTIGLGVGLGRQAQVGAYSFVTARKALTNLFFILQ